MSPPAVGSEEEQWRRQGKVGECYANLGSALTCVPPIRFWVWNHAQTHRHAYLNMNTRTHCHSISQTRSYNSTKFLHNCNFCGVLCPYVNVELYERLLSFSCNAQELLMKNELRAVTNRLKGTPRDLISCNYLSICGVYETQLQIGKSLS